MLFPGLGIQNVVFYRLNTGTTFRDVFGSHVCDHVAAPGPGKT